MERCSQAMAPLSILIYCVESTIWGQQIYHDSVLIRIRWCHDLYVQRYDITCRNYLFFSICRTVLCPWFCHFQYVQCFTSVLCCLFPRRLRRSGRFSSGITAVEIMAICWPYWLCDQNIAKKWLYIWLYIVLGYRYMTTLKYSARE